jgi:hypothetical protein
MCFSLEWLKEMAIWAVVLIGIFAILQLLIPFILSKIGGEISGGVDLVVKMLKIALWVFVAIIVIIIAFDLISCLLGSTKMPTLSPRR